MSDQIASITRGVRQSNFELLRIVAIFMVLAVHADFLALGTPSHLELGSNPANGLTRLFFQGVAIVCVNVFVLISGWFGIKPTVKGFCNFAFQCFYFLIGIYAILVIFKVAPLSVDGLAGMFGLGSTVWFVKAYIALYILSPILNSFIANCSKRQLEITLIAFYAFQTGYGWSGSAGFIANGCSAFSFIGLYLLGRYMHLYISQRVSKSGGVIYIVSVFINVALYCLLSKTGAHQYIFNYTNPLVICGAAGLLLQFNVIKIKPNKVINWIAASAFAVYLFHSEPHIFPHFLSMIKATYISYSGISVILYILLELIGVFVIAILLDQPRKFIWKTISKKLNVVNR